MRGLLAFIVNLLVTIAFSVSFSSEVSGQVEQPDLRDLDARIEDRADSYNVYLERIRSGSLQEQLAALEQALSEKDPSLRTLVIREGLASSNKIVQTSSLRYFLTLRSRIDLQVNRPLGEEAEEQRLYTDYHDLVLERIEIDLRNDTIVARGWEGSLSVDGIKMKQRAGSCKLFLPIFSGSLSIELRGRLECPVRKGIVALPVSASLY